MKILALYDITGIQEYIFSSNKLKENVGASLMVKKALNDFLPEAVNEKCSNPITNWKKVEKFKVEKFNIKDKAEIDAEIVYIGGGNAMVAYKNISTYKNVNKYLSDKLLENTAGMLQLSVAYIETDFENFKEDREKLSIEIRKNKNERLRSLPLMGISINREGITDGLPAEEFYEGDYISTSAYRKREAYKKKEKEKEKEWNYPHELDDLITKDKSSFIAVVHIDGNNMGKTIEEFVESETDYNNAVYKMRLLSKEIEKTYKDAMNAMKEKIIKNIDNDELKERFKSNDNNLPLRPIVRSGDDVTFICNSAIAVPCIECFLKYLKEHPIEIKIEIKEDTIPLSACAGIAIIKSHFPFYRAYKLAEDLCREAKKKGKIAAKKVGSSQTGSWFDFHIVTSGIISGSLSGIRSFHYNSPGMDEPKKIRGYKEKPTKDKGYRGYNLLWRPWCIEGELDEDEKKYLWDNGIEIIKEFRQKDEKGKLKWPRSKLKALRNIFLRPEQEVKAFVSELESRNLCLPEKAFSEKQTPYVDILEIMEHYISLKDN